MRKNVLKNMILALLLTTAVPTLTAQVHVGDILCEGNLIYPPSTYPSSGATAIGVVFYVDNTGQHGWAVALQDAGECSWGRNGFDTPLPNYGSARQAIYDLDGYTNTVHLLMNDNSTIEKQWNGDYYAFMCDYCYGTMNNNCEAYIDAESEIAMDLYNYSYIYYTDCIC